MIIPSAGNPDESSCSLIGCTVGDARCSVKGVFLPLLALLAACRGVGADCTWNSDCPVGLVCLSGRCVVECRADRDCAPGHTCVEGQCTTVAIGADADGAALDALPTEVETAVAEWSEAGRDETSGPASDALESAGPDGSGAACSSTGDCPGGEYCATPPGSCSAAGTCTSSPDHCAPEKVCGCNSKTYDSVCEAVVAGTSVDHVGACYDEPCYYNSDCGQGEYCSFASYLYPKGPCDGPGSCRFRPMFCTAGVRVCGCNDVTYDDDCHAIDVDIQVRHYGACEGFPCTKTSDCGSYELCRFSNATCSGSGACYAITCIDPCCGSWLCGCDGKGYWTGCDALEAGVGAANDGVAANPTNPLCPAP
jgi:hypothetical protein